MNFREYTDGRTVVHVAVVDATTAGQTVQTRGESSVVCVGDVVVKSSNSRYFDVLSPTQWAETGYEPVSVFNEEVTQL